MATNNQIWTKKNEEELFQIKHTLWQIRIEAQKQSNNSTDQYKFTLDQLCIIEQYRQLKLQKLTFSKSCGIEAALRGTDEVLEAQYDCDLAFCKIQEALHQSVSANMDRAQADELHSEFKEEQRSSKKHNDKLNDLDKNIKSFYKLYDGIIYCRHKIIPNELSDKDAAKLLYFAITLSMLMDQRLESRESSAIALAIYNKDMSENDKRTLISLDLKLWHMSDKRTVLHTVLSITTLSDQDQATFRQALKYIDGLNAIYEATYILTHINSRLHGAAIDYNEDRIKKIIEECEQIFMKIKGTRIVSYLRAVTALHFNRTTKYSILSKVMESLDGWKQNGVPPCMNDVIDQAIKILSEQPIHKSDVRSVSPLSSIGMISKTLPKFEQKEKKWYEDHRKYLCIEKSSEVDFSIYIDQSEIERSINFITEQFIFDNTDLYQHERNNQLLNQPLSSIVVYLAENIKINVSDISGQLECGGRIVAFKEDLYITDKSYAELKKTTFDRLCANTEKYAYWFRQIINGSGKDLVFDDQIDEDITILALAKIISESVRNLKTWMINLMSLDLIEKGIVLQEKCQRGSTKARKDPLTSAWNLFFDYHSMTGGSANKSQNNDNEVRNKELHIIMNWLCNCWPGQENITMTSKLDDDYNKQSRVEIEYGDGYYREIITNMLYYRMYLNVRWDGCYDPRIVYARLRDAPHGRRILGRIYFDDQSLISDKYEEIQQSKWNLLVSVDQGEINHLSITRMKKLITQKEYPKRNAFYNSKVRQLQRRELEIQARSISYSEVLDNFRL